MIAPVNDLRVVLRERKRPKDLASSLDTNQILRFAQKDTGVILPTP